MADLMIRYQLSVAVILVGLTACASNGLQSSNAATEPHPGDGYVYASFPAGGGDVPVTIQSLSTGKDYVLGTAADDPRGQGAWVPSGTYKVKKWFDHVLEEYPALSIEAGRLTDMGSLLPVNIGDYQTLVLPFHAPQSDGMATALVELLPVLKTAKPIRWAPGAPPLPFGRPAPDINMGLTGALLIGYARSVNKPSLNQALESAKSVEEALALAKEAQPPFSRTPSRDVNGNLYFGASLGQIRVRSVNGVWGHLDTGTLDDITAVECAGQTLLAGTSGGLILQSRDGGTSWHRLAALERGLVVEDVRHVATSWIVVGSHKEKVFDSASGLDKLKSESLKVYVAKSADLADLAVVNELPVTKAGQLFANWEPHAQSWGNYYFLSVFPDLQRLDVTTLTWKSISPPSTVSGFEISPKSGVIAAYKASGLTSKLYVSINAGDSWESRPAPPLTIYDVLFSSPDIGWAVRRESRPVAVRLELLKYDSSQARWLSVTEAPMGCVQALPDIENVHHLCLTSGGSILRFNAPSWTVEYSTE